MFDDFALIIESENINPCPISITRPLLITMQDNIVSFSNHTLEVNSLSWILLCHSREVLNERLLIASSTTSLNQAFCHLAHSRLIQSTFLLQWRHGDGVFAWIRSPMISLRSALSFITVSSQVERALMCYAKAKDRGRTCFVMDITSVLGVLAVFVLIVANGFFVAAEFALVKVRATRIDQLVNEGKHAAKVVQQQIGHLDTYIAATQLGITLASLALGWIGEPSLAHLIEPLFAWVGGAAEGFAHTAAVAISFFLITMFHIVLGEL